MDRQAATGLPCAPATPASPPRGSPGATSSVVVRVELAGVRSEDLRVTVDGGTLRVSGVRRVIDRSDVKRLHQMEIATGPFERRVQIPVPIDREAVSANLADGFLTVVLPRREAGPRQVEIEE